MTRIMEPKDVTLGSRGEGEQPEQNQKRGRLLVVDDDEGPRKSLQLLFQDHYEVILAASGRQALEALGSGPVDVAVLDLRMPDMSGIELLGHIREKYPEVEVIILTGYESLETARQAIRLGARDYFSKPFDLTAMRAAVAAAMERRQIAAERQHGGQEVVELEKSIHIYRTQMEAARQRGDLYAAVLHDLNNPLTFVTGSLELLQEEIANADFLVGHDLDRVRNMLMEIRRHALACAGIAHRYLRLIRSEAQGDSRALVNMVLSDLSMLLARHRSRGSNALEIVPLENDAVVCMNDIELLQVLLNLTVNALEATPAPHHVTVRAAVLPDALDLSGFKDEPGHCFINREGFVNRPPLIRLDVEDNRPGIAPENGGRVFEPHYTTKGGRAGAGMGLFIVRSLVTAARGALSLTSNPGQGTRFSVFLRSA